MNLQQDLYLYYLKLSFIIYFKVALIYVFVILWFHKVEEYALHWILNIKDQHKYEKNVSINPYMHLKSYNTLLECDIFTSKWTVVNERVLAETDTHILIQIF